MIKNVEVNKSNKKIMDKFIKSIEEYGYNNKIKIGGVSFIVNIDETMLDHKFKSHRKGADE
jgi:hypothetical protein